MQNNMDSIIPENDIERWIIFTYAMWSMATEGNWRHIAGAASNNMREKVFMKEVLRWEWEVKSKETLLGMVEYLAKQYEEEEYFQNDFKDAGWDLCRSCRILGMGYVAGYISRPEMVKLSIGLGKLMQRYYNSWEELYAAYLCGYCEWRKDIGGEYEIEITERKSICKRLLDMSDDRIKWDLILEYM